MPTLREIIDGDDAVVAPCVLNPLMAKLAESAGFRALYLSGGSLGWLKGVSEANLTLTEMIDVAIDIRTVCSLPLIFDAAGGFGDPMHLHRTVALAERAGFAGIEIEDQLLPKRAHHHVGVEHDIPPELMEAKIREAVAARCDPSFAIIARTNASKLHGLDEALRRADGYRRAGADVLFVWTRNEAEMRFVGERLAAPLMIFAPRDGTGAFELSREELGALGYRIIGVPVLPLAAMHKALRLAYARLAAFERDPALPEGTDAEMELVYRTIDFEKLLQIERRTVER